MDEENELIWSHGGIAKMRDKKSGEEFIGTVSDARFLDEATEFRRHVVWVEFNPAPSVKDAANLRHSLAEFRDRSIPDIFRMIQDSVKWRIGNFHEKEAAEIAELLRRNHLHTTVEVLSTTCITEAPSPG